MKTIERIRRHARIAKKISGTAERPRLVVFRSKKHISAQIIDDAGRKIIAAVTTNSKENKAKNKNTGNKDAALFVGKLIAEKAKGLGVTRVCFDRAGYRFHGRIESLARGAREGGLEL